MELMSLLGKILFKNREKAKQFSLIHEYIKQNSIFFEHYPLAYKDPVITCLEASYARGVNLSKELKHIVVMTSQGFCLVHVLGNKRVDTNKVSNFLEVKNAKLADLKLIEKNEMHRGTIFPFVEPFWSMLNLIDYEVLKKDWLTTNDGTLRGFIKFSPKLLLFIPNNKVDVFAD